MHHQWDLRCDLLTAKLIFTANAVALRWRDEYVGTQHLLLAIYQLRDTACLIVLQSLGVAKSDVRTRSKQHLSNQIPVPLAMRIRIACWRIRRYVKYGRQRRSENEAFALLPFSPAAERVLENSAKHRNSTSLPMGYLHIVLGLLEESRSSEILLPNVTVEDVIGTVQRKRTQGQLF